MKKPLYWSLIAVFGIIFLISGFIVVRYLVESYENKQMQNDLINMHNTSGVSRPTGTTDAPSSDSTSTGSTGSTGTTLPTGSTGTTAPTPTVTDPTQPTPTDPTTTPPTSTPGYAGYPYVLPELEELYAQNPHLVGWIYIPGSENPNQNNHGVNYPVVQTPNEKGWHNWYLYRDFYGQDDNHGSIYVREACDVFKPCDNIVIYGHNMADGTMFGQVVNYRYKSYYENHKYIYFDTLYERHTYEVIAVFLTSGTSGVGYTYHSRNNFSSAEDFNEFIRSIKGGDSRVKLYYNIDATAEYGDKLITLSTCWKEIPDGRLVVVAKRIT